ncbi:MAG: hypothetical protein IJW79_03050, partial [Clostridia bacterium]|nr:hypothetical protein [Clostridia bacterium]
MNNRFFSKKLLVVLFAIFMLVSTLPVFGESAETSCDEHTFGYNSDIIAEVTADDVDYKCKTCSAVVKSVKLDKGGIVEHSGTLVLNAKSKDLIEGKAFYADVLRPADGGSIWMTFDVKPTDLSGFSTSTNGSTLLKFQVGSNTHRIMLRAYKVDDKTVRISCQNSAGKEVLLSGSPQLITGNTYKFVIEYNLDTKYYYIYLNGSYVGGSGFQVAYNATDAYKLYFGGSGNWDLTNFKIFNPTYVHGDHTFDYNEYINAELTENGVDFRCSIDNALTRTVDIGRGKPIVIDKITGTSVNLVSNSEDFYNSVIAPADGGSFFMTFDVKPTDLSGFSSDAGGKTLLKFQSGDHHRIMLRAYRVNDKTVRISCQNSAGKEVLLAGSPQLVTDTTYKFIIEYDPDTMNYYIYIDGKYVGGSNYKIDYGASVTYKVQVADSGKWEFTNVKFFNPTHVHDKPIVDTVIE